MERWKCILLGVTRLARDDRGRGQLWKGAEEMGRLQPANVPKGAARILTQALLGDRLRPGKGRVSQSPVTDFTTFSPILLCSGCSSVVPERGKLLVFRHLHARTKAGHCMIPPLQIFLLASNSSSRNGNV